MRTTASVLILGFLLTGGHALRAQSQLNLAQSALATTSKFDVASIKLNKDIRPPNAISLGYLRAVGEGSRNGRFTMKGVSAVPLNLLIQFAYNVRDFQVKGLPSWANSDDYDITANAEDHNATFEQMRPMLQSLLVDRFKLALHRERRELPVYELEVARGGIKIDAAKEGSCFARDDPDHPPAPFKPGAPPPLFCGGVRRQTLSAPPERKDRIEAVGISMPKLVEMLSNEVGLTVVDHTGFMKTFDFHLEFAPDQAIAIGMGPAPLGGLAAPSPSANLSGASIFAALQEQLGLRLQSAKGPVEVLVIDHVERPSEN